MRELLLLLPPELHPALGQRQHDADEGQGGGAAERPGPLQSFGRVCAAEAPEIPSLVLPPVPAGLPAGGEAHAVQLLLWKGG